MAVQDLTPQLRTRLSRVERVVAWFVVLAMLLLLGGFAYYMYHTARSRGWFITKAPFFTFLDSATGLREGDPVRMMGFDVGKIVRIDTMPPEEYFNVYVEFQIRDPYFGYLWTGKGLGNSIVEVASADFLGKRVLQVTKGTNGYPIYIFYPFRDVTPTEAATFDDLDKRVFVKEVTAPVSKETLAKTYDKLSRPLLEKMIRAGVDRVSVADTRSTRKTITGVWNDQAGGYDVYTRTTKPYWLVASESAAVTERLEAIATQVEKALPDVFRLTNQLTAVLTNTAQLTAHADALVLQAQPIVTNLTVITSILTNGSGALGDWLIPTNLNQKLDTTLATANTTLARADSLLFTADTNVATLSSNVNLTLINLANITSNLNAQVQTNDQILSSISSAVTNADNLLQGLKRHWLLRSAFREKDTNKPPRRVAPVLSPKARSQQR